MAMINFVSKMKQIVCNKNIQEKANEYRFSCTGALSPPKILYEALYSYLKALFTGLFLFSVRDIALMH